MRQLSQNVLDVPSAPAPEPAPAQDNEVGPPVFLELLWRRKWTVAICVTAFVLGAAVYLWQATPIYRSSVRLQVEQSAPQVNKDPDHIEPVSESFLQTQVDAM